MVRSILRGLTTLIALIVTYQAYVLMAVPMLDPPLEAREQQQPDEGEVKQAITSVTRYQVLLANYFPKGHWSQVNPPKVFASADEKAMLVIDDYKRHDEIRVKNDQYTQVDITRFAMLIFPTPPREGITPPRDTIILESPRGARLKFDEFRPELGRIGQIIGGQFPGMVTIRSDMHEEGPDDDLLVETADLEMNAKLLYSSKPVRFRLGKNVGGGRELEIRFLPDEHVRPSSSGLKIAGIDSLEIRREFRMRLYLDTKSLLPGADAEPTKDTNAAPTAAITNNNSDPVEVSCSGPFTFDFVRYVASLDRDVDLRQTHPNGPSDQLYCSQLDLHFAPKNSTTAEAQSMVVDPGKRQQRDLGRLEPAALVAKGHPVVVTSPARNAQARGDRVQIALREQRVRLAGSREAMLVFDNNVIRAPIIDYQHPSRDSATPLGRFRATGPGTLQYVPDSTKPEQIFQANWQTLVDLNRENGQPVLTLDGRPQLAFAGSGSLSADHIKMFLRELHSETPVGGIEVKTGQGEAVQVVPDRILASGNVDIQSARLTGRTGELIVGFQVQPEPPADANAQADPAQNVAPSGGGFAEKLAGGMAAGPMQQAFHMSSDRMKLDVTLRGKSASPTTLACDGNVLIREAPTPGAQEQPLEIRGTQLIVDRLDSIPFVTLKGASVAGANDTSAVGTPGTAGLAQLSGRGVTMFVRLLEIDARDNRMWSDGTGKAVLLVSRNLEGQQTPQPFPLDLTWQGGMQFDGTTITFDRDVVAAGVDDRLQCSQLSARLNTHIKFGETIDQKAIDVAELQCLGGVTINHLTRDNMGVTSHERVELARLAINQQTGNVVGDGPGTIRSTRLGDNLALFMGAPNAASKPVAAQNGPGQKLNFMRVDFRGGLNGNIVLRTVEFQNQVRTLYGPVDAWEQELDPNQPQLFPPDVMTMTCDTMRINEDQGATRAVAANGQKPPFGPIQFKATGNVLISGQVPKYGPFRAQAEIATYEQAKDAFVLEGGRTPATLLRPGQGGAPPAARLIRWVRSTNEFSVQGIQSLEITPQDVKGIENARKPGNVR